ncbi:hypothetical protein BB559_003505 [Furculomyces boomerangus]|uniref:Uncharacterized protein n=1 Tax=Furculomyces boomerangus TaxID=61424 RepID=A0A2T9Y9G3_9FUNG|nr:hypothetical protein BB559_005306 [Furculomyces boomerangus]PVU91099.1 hypothetical protein BB559_004300 [Furculomyces boomerangus]PVU93006.1 hypothetical protein BB559_003505 [Furculomyces boomerangus]
METESVNEQLNLMRDVTRHLLPEQDTLILEKAMNNMNLFAIFFSPSSTDLKVETEKLIKQCEEIDSKDQIPLSSDPSISLGVEMIEDPNVFKNYNVANGDESESNGHENNKEIQGQFTHILLRQSNSNSFKVLDYTDTDDLGLTEAIWNLI